MQRSSSQSWCVDLISLSRSCIYIISVFLICSSETTAANAFGEGSIASEARREGEPTIEATRGGVEHLQSGIPEATFHASPFACINLNKACFSFSRLDCPRRYWRPKVDSRVHWSTSPLICLDARKSWHTKQANSSE